jgi:drug/metabolite transporter (DMT)-like permease
MTSPISFAATSSRLAAVFAARPLVAAIALMVLGSGLMAMQHAVIRHVSSNISGIESTFFRNIFGLVTLLPWLLRVGPAGLSTRRFPLHATRATINALANAVYFTALATVPLANATALNLTIPLFVCVGAALFLRERITGARWLAVAVGLVGALVIVRPGVQAVSTGTLMVLGSAVFAATARLMAKSLSRTDSASAVVAWGSILMTPVTLIPAAMVWVWPQGWEWPFMFAIGALGALGQMSFVRAYALADISFAEPMVFTRLLWAAGIGLLWFGEFPDLWTWAGGAMIVAGITLMARGGGRH